MVIPLFLVIFGFFVVFYSSSIDLVTTYLPERLVKYSLPLGIFGWGVQSLITGDYSLIISCLQITLFSFLFGGFLYYTKQWASGDMWLMAAASSLLSPAFFDFWPKFFLYSIIWSGILGITFFVYFFVKHKMYKKFKALTFTNIVALFFTIINPFPGMLLFCITLLLLLFASRKDLDNLFIIEKKANELEEDDWLLKDLKCGKHIIKASRPIGQKEVKIARKYAKGNIKIKSGVPMTPAFSLALITILFT